MKQPGWYSDFFPALWDLPVREFQILKFAHSMINKEYTMKTRSVCAQGLGDWDQPSTLRPWARPFLSPRTHAYLTKGSAPNMLLARGKKRTHIVVNSLQWNSTQFRGSLQLLYFSTFFESFKMYKMLTLQKCYPKDVPWTSEGSRKFPVASELRLGSEPEHAVGSGKLGKNLARAKFEPYVQCLMKFERTKKSQVSIDVP